MLEGCIRKPSCPGKRSPARRAPGLRLPSVEAAGCDGRPAVRARRQRPCGQRHCSTICQAAAVAYDRRYRRSSTEDRPQFALTAPIGLSEARRLAHVLDSLVRVSRRDGQSTDTVHRDPRVGGLIGRRQSKSSDPGESPNARHRSDACRSTRRRGHSVPHYLETRGRDTQDSGPRVAPTAART